jgi:hypothetical protein
LLNHFIRANSENAIARNSDSGYIYGTGASAGKKLTIEEDQVDFQERFCRSASKNKRQERAGNVEYLFHKKRIFHKNAHAAYGATWAGLLQ